MRHIDARQYAATFGIIIANVIDLLGINSSNIRPQVIGRFHLSALMWHITYPNMAYHLLRG